MQQTNFNKPLAEVRDPHRLHQQQPQQPAVQQSDAQKCFVNDLTPDEIEKAVAEYSARIRAMLSTKTITVNTMSRLVNAAHPKVSAFLRISSSARDALLGESARHMVRADAILQKLTSDERRRLLEKLKDEDRAEADCRHSP